MTKAKFDADFKVGRGGEKDVADFMVEAHNGKNVKWNSDNKFDFTIEYDKKPFKEKIEVKTDKYAATTDELPYNLYLEYEWNKIPSGLVTTKADRWAVYVPREGEKRVYFFCPKAMWDYLKQSNHRKVKGGDNKKGWGYLLPQDIAERLDICEIAEMDSPF